MCLLWRERMREHHVEIYSRYDKECHIPSGNNLFLLVHCTCLFLHILSCAVFLSFLLGALQVEMGQLR